MAPPCGLMRVHAYYQPGIGERLINAWATSLLILFPEIFQFELCYMFYVEKNS